MSLLNLNKKFFVLGNLLNYVNGSMRQVHGCNRVSIT